MSAQTSQSGNRESEKRKKRRRVRKIEQICVITDTTGCAEAVGLRYVTDSKPGIRRERSGEIFCYYDIQGSIIETGDTLERIQALRIPPAWTDVWICPIAHGHLQATGRDARGRKQYLYHQLWRIVRDEAKFFRMIPFGNALPVIRERIETDLKRRGMAREKVLATVIQLLEKTLIRVGNREYARDNNSFGLTTLRNRHVEVSGEVLRFHFRGKSGKEHMVEVNDRRLARLVKRCRDIPGYELFQYVDEEGERRTIDSSDVNDYLKEITGDQFTAKDFRTWGGTVQTATTLLEIGPYGSETEAKRNVVQAVKTVAESLGNKPSVCRKYYIHPAVIESYLCGNLARDFEAAAARVSPSPWLDPEEAALLALLKKYDEEKLTVAAA